MKAIFCDAPQTSREAWLVFQLAHFLRHQTYQNAITTRVTASRLDNIEPTDPGWMLDHAQTHFDICKALNIAANPNLGESDLSDPVVYESWMLMHRDEHELIDRALGL